MSTLKGYASNPKTLSGIIDVVADTAQVGGITIDNDNINGISNFTASDITCTNLTATNITGGTISYTTATVDDLVVNDSTLIDCDVNITSGNTYNINGAVRLSNDTLTTSNISPIAGSDDLNINHTGILNFNGNIIQFEQSSISRIIIDSAYTVLCGGNTAMFYNSLTNRLGLCGITNPSFTVHVNTGDLNLQNGSLRIGGTSILSSTALGSSVVSSSLTSLGTLSGLTVGGTITQSSGTASLQALTVPSISCSGNISGTLTTASQPNITSLGTLTSLTVGGNISGTLTTASQPNITSLGTLAGLTVGGTITQTGGLATLAETVINRPSSLGAGNIVEFRYNNAIEARIDENGNFYAQDGDFSDLFASNLCDVFNLQVNNDATLQSDLFFNSTTGVIQNVNDNIVKITGNLRVDTSTLTVDATNDRVGIKTTSPAYPLDVAGTCNISTGSTYKINTVDVLSSTTLGAGVVNASLNSITPVGGKLDINGNLEINDNSLFLRNNDTNHAVRYAGITPFAGTGYDGPVVYGFSGGILGSTNGGERRALVWDNNRRVAVNNNTVDANFQFYNNGYIRTQSICCRVIIGLGGISISPNTSLFDNGASVTFDLFPSSLGSFGFIVTGAPWQGMYRAPITGYYRVSMSCRFSDGGGGTKGLKPVRRNLLGTIFNVIGVADGIVWCPEDGAGRRVAVYDDIVLLSQGEAVFPTLHSTQNMEWATMAVNLINA